MTKEKILLLTLAVIQFSHITDFMILMPLGPQLMDSFNILPSQFALLVSTYTFSAGTSGFVGAFFIDRFDRKKAILTMAAGFALGTLACGFAQTYYSFINHEIHHRIIRRCYGCANSLHHWGCYS